MLFLFFQNSDRALQCVHFLSGRSLVGHYYHSHFDRNSTKEEILEHIKRRVSPGLVGNAVNPATHPGIGVSTRSHNAARRKNGGESTSDQTPVIHAPRRARRPKPSFQSSHAFPDSSFDPTTREGILSYDQRSWTEGRDTIEPLAIMSLPLIKTPQKLDRFGSPWAKGYSSDGPGARTFVSTDTPTALSPPPNPGSCERLMDFLGLPLVDDVSHAWTLLSPTEGTIRTTPMTSMSPSSSSSIKSRRLDEPTHHLVHSRSMDDQRIRLLPLVPTPFPSWHEKNWNESLKETGTIPPIDRGHCFDSVPTRESFAGAPALSDHITLQDDRQAFPRVPSTENSTKSRNIV